MGEPRAGRSWRWLGVVVFALALYVIVRAANSPQADTPPAPGAPASPSASPTGPSASATPSAYDPADHASQVRTRARQTGVSAQLLMAILYNESYKPHDPDLERAWQRYKSDSAFGIANMHRAAFDEVKQGRDFANRSWEELPDDRDLAIEAEAWYLHDLSAQLPAQWPAAYSRDELLALGYNTGAGNMLAFARGATPGSQAQSYLDKLHANWAKAGKAVAP
ncbi:lytic transglycosylase domain-containing protein [Streptomyces sp. RY43-2]|uniref:Lytic transglycosylase domain-containing protein n=1 Tax=Streptomyces macrolidinus TaxID=2952607 RepID=A0ABT0Z9K7_9ACTN|nr:lytic transglycosylase domain-containing protein [Streptomyces macrolidinus]MCN9240439.1 lytic transglycosylase domain-containing protein [Streptomyces macrolidinus]